MNVGDLRRCIAGLSDNMPIVTNSEFGWIDEVSLYLAPAHLEHHTYGNVISKGPARRSTPGWPYEQTDCQALLISAWGEYDDGVVALMPSEDRPTIIDSEQVTGGQ